MDLAHRAVALYGRFSPGGRDRLAQRVVAAEGGVSRDLTRRSDALVVGSLATALIDSGALAGRLAAARERGLDVWGERGFAAALEGRPQDAATLALSTALTQSGLARPDADLLVAFDLAVIEREHCRFGDVGVFRTAAELMAQGRTRGEALRILLKARQVAPAGRHRIVLTGQGQAALKWDEGLTSLEGQSYLPLDEAHASLEDLFEQATLAEAGGYLDEAARLYDLCARADRGDAIASFNYGNIRLAQGAFEEAALAYQRALARDPDLLEARYNLAQAREAAGRHMEAVAELEQVVAADAGYPDALFNLAQLRMKAGDLAVAKGLYERYLELGPPDDWAATARKAITYCAANL